MIKKMILALLIVLSVGLLPVQAGDEVRQGFPELAWCSDKPDEPVCRVEHTWNLAQVRQRLAGDQAPVWGNGDELYFVYQGAADGVFLNGGIQTMMDPLNDEHDLWGVAVRVQNREQAIIGYGFIPITDGMPDWEAQEFAVWRGPKAPVDPPYAEHLSGTVRTYKLDYLDDKRAVVVYLPPEHDPAQTYPVLYMADGQLLDGMAHYIEPLIVDGTLPPLVVVGIPASDQSQGGGDDPRAAEYLIGMGDPRFYAHEKFLLDDVIPWAEAEFGASTTREERAVFGFSNGAAFAITMGLRHPDTFGNVIAFSVAWLPFDIPNMQIAPPGRYYLEAGTLEPDFKGMTQDWAANLRSLGADVTFHERVGGHDSTIWRAELPDALGWIWGA